MGRERQLGDLPQSANSRLSGFESGFLVSGHSADGSTIRAPNA
jgi:hypothetical protein